MRTQRIPKQILQLFALDAIFTVMGLWIATLLRASIPLGQGGSLSLEQTSLPWPVYIISVACWSTSLVLNSAYDARRVLRWFNEAARVLWASIVAIVLIAGFLYMTFREVSRLQFIYFFVTNVGLLLTYRAILRLYFRAAGRSRLGGRNRVIIVGAGELGCRLADVLRDHSRWGYSLVGFLDDDKEKSGKTFQGLEVLGRIIDVKEIVQQKDVDEIWVALPVWALDRLNLIMTELETVAVRVKVVPDYFSMALVRAKADTIGGIPVIGLRDPVIEGFPRIVKRTFDIVIGAVLLLICLPFLLIITLAIRLDSPGRIIFTQKRIGENGGVFEMYKFRTMIADAEQKQAEVIRTTEDGTVIHKQVDDPRVTRFGRFLRRYSLDELPQFLNVLKGEMSLVGPRPEMPWLVDRYESWQRKRFAVPQGLTGWWQINGRSDKPMHLNPEDDLYYVYNYSLWLDIIILLRTPIAVLSGRGAF